MPTIKKIFFKKISTVLGLFIVCGFSLTLGAILLRVAFSAFTQPTLPPTDANQELGALEQKISALESTIGTPGDAVGEDTVFGKIAGVGGGGSSVVTVTDPNNLGGTKMLSGNFCAASGGGGAQYVLNDIEVNLDGLIRISDLSLNDTDNDGFKESTLVPVNKLWISSEGRFVESVSNIVSIPARDSYKCIIQTPAIYLGNLGGLTGGDAACQSAAISLGAFGVYKVWLSSDTVSASSRLTHADISYYSITGKKIANVDNLI